MPSKPRRPDSAGSVLQEIFGQAFDFVGKRVQEAAPRCSLCTAIAIPLRCACGGFACKDHGYFNFVLGRVICPDCAMSLGVAVEPEAEDEYEEPVPRPAPPRAHARWRRQQRRRSPKPSQEAVSFAWETLGLDPATATESEINKAYRQEAKACHPDLHPGDTSAKRRFQGLQRAKELCLADLASRQEG